MDKPASRTALLVGYALSQIVFIFVASDAFLLRVDDSFYYYGIAWHVVEGGRFTFDGLHLTNGFQPLWQFVLIGLTALIRAAGVTDRDTAMRIYAVVCALLSTLSLHLALGLVERHLGLAERARKVTLFFFVWLPGLTVSLLAGMESAVNWPLLIGFFRLLTDEHGAPRLASLPRRRFAALVVVSILLVLARLDNAIILATTVVVLWSRERSAASVRRGLVWGALVVVAWAPLLAWGQHAFASPTPVSGSVKLWNTGDFIARAGAGSYARAVVQAFVLSVLALPVSALGMGYYEVVKPIVLRLGFAKVIGLLGVFVVLALVLLALVVRSAQRSRRPAAPPLLSLLAVVSVVHLATLVVLFPDQWMYAGLIWYDLVEYLCLFVLAGWLGGWLAASLSDGAWRALVRGALATSALALVPLILWRPSPPTQGQVKRIAARWIDAHLPAGAVLASDDAGALGFFAHRPVINLDGLVNDRAYLDHYLRPHKKRQYLDDAGVTYLADIHCPKSQNERFRSLLHIPADGDIVLKLDGNEPGLDFCIVEIHRR